MLTIRVVPCLEVEDGQVVNGGPQAENRDPASLAGRYEREGADEIVVFDISATGAAGLTCTDTVRQVRETLSIPLTVGGGVRDLREAAGLIDSGADRIMVTSAAVERPALLAEITGHFGAQCAVIAIAAARTEARGCTSGYEVRTRSGLVRTGIDVAEWARRSVELGAGEIILTSADRNGSVPGYDLDLLRAVREAVSVPIVTAGDRATPGHMTAAIGAGADAVLATPIFHLESCSVGRLKDRLSRLGAAVRK